MYFFYLGKLKKICKIYVVFLLLPWPRSFRTWVGGLIIGFILIENLLIISSIDQRPSWSETNMITLDMDMDMGLVWPICRIKNDHIRAE
jgi:hypothetical protein